MICAALSPPEVLDQTELKFLEDFCNLLRTAHYRMLTQEEWETATEEEYTVSITHTFDCTASMQCMTVCVILCTEHLLHCRPLQAHAACRQQ